MRRIEDLVGTEWAEANCVRLALRAQRLLGRNLPDPFDCGRLADLAHNPSGYFPESWERVEAPFDRGDVLLIDGDGDHGLATACGPTTALATNRVSNACLVRIAHLSIRQAWGVRA